MQTGIDRQIFRQTKIHADRQDKEREAEKTQIARRQKIFYVL